MQTVSKTYGAADTEAQTPVCGEDGKTHGNSCEACSWGKNDKYTKGGC